MIRKTAVGKASIATMVAALLATTGQAARAPKADPRIAQTDALFAAWNKPTSPGCNVFVFENGKIAFQRGYGMADLEADLPLKPDSVFYIASMSKQFTAAAIALLVEEHKVDLAASPRRYIPELPPLYDRITVGQMLHHTAGLRDYLALGFLTGQDVLTNDRALALLRRQVDLNFAPGSKWSYSNSGYVLLSVIVERVSGQSFKAFLQTRIFQPLGMAHSSVDQDHRNLVKGRVQSYVADGKGGWLHLPKTIDATGDGNVLTTVADLRRWDENFYSGKVGGPGFAARMTADAVEAGPGLRYAWGLMLQTYRGQPVVRHGGAFDGFRTELVRFPQKHGSAGLLCNAGNVDANLALKVADIWLPDLAAAPIEAKAPSTPKPPSPAWQPTPAQLAAFTGRFRSPELDREFEIFEQGGALQLRGLSDQPQPLTPIAADTLQFQFDFAGAGTLKAEIKGVPNARGKIDRLGLSAARTDNIRFDRID